MDPLSDVLTLLSVRGMNTARLEASGNWAMSFAARPGMKFAGAHEGAFWLWTAGGEEPVRIEAGDFYLLPHGQHYLVGTGRDMPPADGAAVMSACRGDDGIVRYGAGSARVVATGGRFLFDDSAHALLLAFLPPVIHIRASSSTACALRSLLELLRLETERSQPGAAVVAGGLGTMILVEILRAQLAAEQHTTGWLGALADPRIGAAMRLMHGDVRRRWTAQSLAGAVGMSRTAFCERFRERVGMPPLSYLASWRMTLARKALRSGTRSLTEIAVAIGYESDTAFSAAFRRASGLSPGRYRAQARPVQGAA